MNTVHKPVLLEESIKGLNLRKGAVAVDATLGGGGHSCEMLKNILPNGKLIAIDRDVQSIENFKSKIKNQKLSISENLILVNDNFAKLEDILKGLKITKVDAILADFGISSDQLDKAERGFSFQKDGPLDMRMDQSRGITAKDIVNGWEEEKIWRMLRENADESFAKSIARKIAKVRREKEIETVLGLVDVISQAVPAQYKRRKTHFATKTFLALRMEVNGELGNIERFLSQAVDSLKTGGRLSVITFHSGEDKLVKNILRVWARGCTCPPNFPVCRCGKKASLRIISRRPIVPEEEEIRSNPRSRSAKLRIAEKI